MRHTLLSRGLAADLLLILTGGGRPITGALGQPPVGTQEPRHTPPLRDRRDKSWRAAPGSLSSCPASSSCPRVWPQLHPWAYPSTHSFRLTEGWGALDSCSLVASRSSPAKPRLQLKPPWGHTKGSWAHLGPRPSFQPIPQGSPTEWGAWASGWDRGLSLARQWGCLPQGKCHCCPLGGQMRRDSCSPGQHSSPPSLHRPPPPGWKAGPFQDSSQYQP